MDMGSRLLRNKASDAEAPVTNEVEAFIRGQGDVIKSKYNPATKLPFTCCFCGMPVESLHEIKERAVYELKFRCHWKCRKYIEKYADSFNDHPALRHFHPESIEFEKGEL